MSVSILKCVFLRSPPCAFLLLLRPQVTEDWDTVPLGHGVLGHQYTVTLGRWDTWMLGHWDTRTPGHQDTWKRDTGTLGHRTLGQCVLMCTYVIVCACH